jgi:hypothetical protein
VDKYEMSAEKYASRTDTVKAFLVPVSRISVSARGGSGLNFLGSGGARVLAFGLGLLI